MSQDRKNGDRMAIHLNRRVRVYAYNVVGEVGFAQRRDELRAVMQLGVERQKKLTAQDLCERLLAGRPVVVGQRRLALCERLGLVEREPRRFGRDASAFLLTQVGLQTAQSGDVFVPERGTWTFWVTDDPLLPPLERLLCVKPFKEPSAMEEVFGKKEEKPAERRTEPLPDWVQAASEVEGTLLWGDGRALSVNTLEEQAEPVAAETDVTLTLSVAPDAEPVVRLAGTLDGQHANAVLEAVPAPSFAEVWRHALGRRASDWDGRKLAVAFSEIDDRAHAQLEWTMRSASRAGVRACAWRHRGGEGAVKRADAGATLLTWHAEGAGVEVLGHALRLLARQSVPIHRVLYLRQVGTALGEEEVRAQASKLEVEVLRLELRDPTQHESVYALVRDQVLPRVRACQELHVNVSPGTPAMHAVWLILHAAGAFPPGTRLWSSQYDKKTQQRYISPVTFAPRTYLGEIRQVVRNEPRSTTYDPEPRSPARRAALDMLRRYARIPGAPLLVVGERGTGKTRLVETYLAPLKQRPLVALACGTLEGADVRLAESELFGHAKGAFTGAERARKGLVAKASGGVLFLDEVQDLPRALQRKLVRMLQDARRRYRPVGADDEDEADVDIVCASNLPLEQLTERLDADLYDRLSLLTVQVPALRECREDLPEDWQRVWGSLRRDALLPEEAPTSQALRQALATAPLHGNLRDLQRLALVVMAWWPERGERALELALEEWQRHPRGAVQQSFTQGSGTRTEQIRAFRRELAVRAKETHGTWKQAAQALGCDEKTLREDAGLLSQAASQPEDKG